MGTFFKFLLFCFIFYMLFTWIRRILFGVARKKEMKKEVRLFKSKNVEKSQLDIQDAETVDFEEIKDPRDNQI